jgi:phage gpG-like protein
VTTRLQLVVDGDRAFVEFVEGIRDRTRDARPAFERIARDFYAIETEQFASEGARMGALWRKATDKWVRRKLRMGRSARTLVFTGTLEASLTRPGAKWGKKQITSDEIVIGTRDPVAHLHNDRNRLIDLQQADRARWRGFIRDHIFTTGTGDSGGIAGLGGRIGL